MRTTHETDLSCSRVFVPFGSALKVVVVRWTEVFCDCFWFCFGVCLLLSMYVFILQSA